MLNVFLLLLSCSMIVPCLIPLFLFGGPPRRRSTSFCVLLGMGLQYLLAMPAGLAQAYYYIERVQDKSAILRLVIPFMAAPFNIGGFSVRGIFEMIAGPPNEGGSGMASGAIADYHVYLPLVLFQSLLFATAFARRFQESRKLSDPVVLLLGGAILLNSLLNASWPWWGG